MAADHDQSDAPTPLQRVTYALAPWPWLLGGLIMLGGIWLMPAYEQLRQLQHQRQLVEHEVTQSRLRLEVQQQMERGLAAGDPVLLERLACHYLGARPVDVEVVSDRPRVQLAAAGQASAAQPVTFAPLPIRETWQDLVDQTTTARLASLPPVQAYTLPADTLLTRLTMGPGRLPLLLIAAVCLWFALRPRPELPRPEQNDDDEGPINPIDWLQQLAPQPALATAAVQAGETPAPRQRSVGSGAQTRTVTRPSRLEKPVGRQLAAGVPARAAALDLDDDALLGTGLLRALAPEPVELDVVQDGRDDEGPISTTFATGAEVESVAIVEEDRASYFDTIDSNSFDRSQGPAYDFSDDAAPDVEMGLMDDPAEASAESFDSEVSAEVAEAALLADPAPGGLESLGPADEVSPNDPDLWDIPSHSGTSEPAPADQVAEDVPASVRHWFQGGKKDDDRNKGQAGACDRCDR